MSVLCAFTSCIQTANFNEFTQQASSSMKGLKPKSTHT